MDQSGLLTADVGTGTDPQFEVKGETAPSDRGSKPTLLAGLSNGTPQPGNRQGVFSADVDEAMLSANREGGDGHPLKHAVGITLEDGAVHECPGVTFIGVADQPFFGTRHRCNRGPLQPGGITGATTTTQAAAADQINHRLGLVRRQDGIELLVGPCGFRIAQILRIDLPAALQHDPPLEGQKWRLRIEGPATPWDPLPERSTAEGLL